MKIIRASESIRRINDANASKEYRAELVEIVRGRKVAAKLYRDMAIKEVEELIDAKYDS